MRLQMANQPQYYVSLGDSISIDDYAGGPGCGAASLLFRNRDTAFPDWNGRDLTSCLTGVRFVPLARDGATAPAVRYVQIPQLVEMGAVPSIVTLTVGGNDLIQSWLNNDAAHQAHLGLREHVSTVLSVLRSGQAKKIPILLGTIYDPSDGTHDSNRLQLLHWPRALEWLAAYNDTIKSLAAEYDAILADIHTHFIGHGLSAGDPTRHEAEPKNRELWYCGTIEPNAWGANAVRALWWNHLEAAGFFTEET